MTSTQCPSPDDIFRWVAGHFVGTDHGRNLAAHLAACRGECPGFLQASEVAIGAVLESLEAPRPAELPRQSHDELYREATQLDREAQAMFQEEASRWATTFQGHPLRDRLRFLYRVADKAVYFADEKPSEVLALAALLQERAVEAARSDPSEANTIRALAGLAEGLAIQAQGNHIAALATFDRAERAWWDPAFEPDRPRIDLARAYSFRRLRRFDEAREALKRAHQDFTSWGLKGTAKTLWQLAILENTVGNHRASLRAANQARKLFLAEDDPVNARVILQVATLSLISLGRLRPAERILATLAGDPEIRRVPQHLARVRWNQAQIAAARGAIPEALDTLEEVIDVFVEQGNLAAAASALLDVATVAWVGGNASRQASAAGRALALLRQLPGLDVDVTAAMAHLEAAVREQLTGAALAAVVKQAHDVLKR